MSGSVQDVNISGDAVRELARLRRLCDALGSVNEAIASITDQQKLLEEICRVSVEGCGFRMAEVSWYDPANRRLFSRARWGDPPPGWRMIEPLGEDELGPLGIAFKTGEPHVCTADASASFPILGDRGALGVFTVIAAGPDELDAAELAHLNSIAANLSWALASLDRVEAQRQAEMDTQMLASIVASTDDAIFTQLLDGTISTWNPAAERMFGYQAAEIIGQNLSILIPPERREADAEARKRLAEGELATGIETVRRRKDGSLFPASITISKLFGRDGVLDGYSKIVRDDTKRNQARDKLSELQLAFTTVVQNSSEGVFTYRTETETFELNPAGLQMLEMSREELTSLGLAGLNRKFEMLDADGVLVPEPEWPLTRVIRGESVRDVELSLRNVETDKVRHLRFTGGKAATREGTSIAFVTAQDVTKRKRSEQALLEASKFSDQIIAGAGEGILVLDRQWRVLVFNPVMEQLMGLRADDVLGRSIIEIVPPWMKDGLMTRLKRALRGKVIQSGDTYIPGNQTSPGRWISTKNAPLRNAKGEITGVIKIVNEVTDRKINEESLKGIITELANAQRIANIGSWEWDVERDYLRLSTQLFVIFGVSKEKFGTTSEDFLRRILPEDRPAMEAAQEATVRGKARLDIELRIVSSDGCIKWLHVLGDITVGPSGSVTSVAGTAHDVTSRKRAEESLRELKDVLEVKVAERTAELQTARVQAESADRLKSAFLATMSHELRTPLNSIIGFTGILVNRLPGPLNEEQLKQLLMVQSSARHLLALINDVLDISKIEAGQLEVQLEDFDLRASIDIVMNMMKPLAEKKNIDLALVSAPELAILHSDKRRVEQILVNLLSNAIKFTEYGRVTVVVDSPNYLVSPGEIVRIHVADTGIGIREEELETIFQPFRQIDSGLTRKHEGTGLGLAISRRLVECLNGSISVESKFGRGSVFTVTLPGC